MDASLGDVRWDVVAYLHERLENVPAGSQKARMLERALDLALSPKRALESVPMLIRDVLRNAEFLERRTAARTHRAYTTYLGGSPTVVSDLDVDGVVTDGPEAVALCGALIRHLRDEAVNIGGHGLLCLIGLFAGESAAVTAAAAGVSKATIDRARSRLRVAARAWAALEDADGT